MADKEQTDVKYQHEQQKLVGSIQAATCVLPDNCGVVEGLLLGKDVPALELRSTGC